jgi:tetratricopeptide (TPR) repeat protein
MTPTQVASRDAIMARAQRAREELHDRTSTAFQREMGAVTAEFEALVHEVEGMGADPLEHARAWRFLGNAYFDLGDGHEHGWLRRAADAFAQSEALARPFGDAIESTKLNYSYGHTLYHLASGGDRSLLVEARRRYALALEQARRVFPEGVEDIEEALANADQVLALLGQADRATEHIERLQGDLDVPSAAPPEAPDPLRQMMGPLWESLRREFAEKRASAEIAPDRAVELEDMMETITGMVERTMARGRVAEGTRTREISDSGEVTMQSLLEELGRIRDDREKLERMKERQRPKIQRPSRAAADTAAPHSRAGRVIAHLEELKVTLGMEGGERGRTQGEHEAAIELFTRLIRLIATLHHAHEDEARVLTLEREQARPLVQELRWYSRRHHPALVRPLWSHHHAPPDPNLVFYSGPVVTRALLDTALAERGASRAHLSRSGVDSARARWEELRSSGLAFFDLSGGAPESFYELGMALVTGVDFVLAAAEGTEIPFDVGQNVESYRSRDQLLSFLGDELDSAFYRVRSRGEERSSVAETALYAGRLASAGAAHSLASVAARQLSEAARDPMEFRAALAAFARYLTAELHVVLYPRWPVSYPDPLVPRCFVVMPFREELDPVWRAVAGECQQAGVEPVRGDVAEGQQILHSIWEEIGRATYIVGDLTGLNLNVCLELGIAHALGRRTLLIGGEGTEKSLFLNLAKERCHTYSAGGRDDTGFRRTLRNFFTSR